MIKKTKKPSRVFADKSSISKPVKLLAPSISSMIIRYGKEDKTGIMTETISSTVLPSKLPTNEVYRAALDATKETTILNDESLMADSFFCLDQFKYCHFDSTNNVYSAVKSEGDGNFSITRELSYLNVTLLDEVFAHLETGHVEQMRRGANVLKHIVDIFENAVIDQKQYFLVSKFFSDSEGKTSSMVHKTIDNIGGALSWLSDQEKNKSYCTQRLEYAFESWNNLHRLLAVFCSLKKVMVEAAMDEEFKENDNGCKATENCVNDIPREVKLRLGNCYRNTESKDLRKKYLSAVMNLYPLEMKIQFLSQIIELCYQPNGSDFFLTVNGLPLCFEVLPLPLSKKNGKFENDAMEELISVVSHSVQCIFEQDKNQVLNDTQSSQNPRLTFNFLNNLEIHSLPHLKRNLSTLATNDAYLTNPLIKITFDLMRKTIISYKEKLK